MKSTIKRHSMPTPILLLSIVVLFNLMIPSTVFGSSTWVIERRLSGDIIRNIPGNFKCGESVQDWYLNKTSGLCQCVSTTPTFVVYGDGSFGCIRSKSACQGKRINIFITF